MSSGFLLKRLIFAIPTLLGVSVIVFVLLRVVPGDPIAMMIPPGASQGDIDHLRQLYGLHKPIVEQYILWLGELSRGELGTSISLRQDVLTLILQRLPATLELSIFAMLLAILLALLFALIGTYWRGRWPEIMVDGFTGLNQAIPDFLWGLIFILLLGVVWPVLPISGRIDPRLSLDFSSQFYLVESIVLGEWQLSLLLLSYLLLPAVALALPLTAVLTRLLKASLKEALSQDYILLARVKGFSQWRIILVDALRNALIPAVTLSGVQFNFLLGGTVLIERIFSYPGIGNMAIGAVIERDLPLIQGLILTFAVLFIVINLLTDMTCRLLNPRLNHG